MNAGPMKETKSPAAPKRRAWFTLHPQQPTLEEACRRSHAFATRFPLLYRVRVTLLTVTVLLTPFCFLAFLTAGAAGFPWFFGETPILQPLFAGPVLRWAWIGLLFALMTPLLVVNAAGMVRGLTLRLPDPGGKRLEKKQAPRLYRMLAEMAASLDAPAVEEVRVTPERVLEVRREPCGGLGILGRPRTILMTGLPLAEELSPQQFRALVAHELAHLATHKRRFGGLILGLRGRLDLLRQAAEASALERGFWSRLPDESLVDTLHATIRRLTAATFPVVRRHEAEADAIAAAIAGRDYAASALLRQCIAGHAVSHHFQELCLRLAETSAELPADLFDRRAAAACRAFSETQVSAWLRTELDVKDNLAESHPPLWERLRLLGFRIGTMNDFRALLEEVQPHRELGETAARFFLGEAAETLRAEFFHDWAARQSGDWRKRFSVYETLRVTAAEWERGGAATETDPAALWQIAVALGNTRSWRAALPLAQRVLELSPEHADANMLVGQLLIEDGNPAGVEAVERAMKSDSRMTPLGCKLVARFLEGRGEPEAAGGYQKRGEESEEQQQMAARERTQVRVSDEFLAPDCSSTTAQVLLRVLERHSSHVRAAYLMRTQGPERDGKPHYVLGVERRVFAYENVALANRLLLERIMRVPGMPADVLVCVATRANRQLVEKWKAVPHARLFPCTAGSWPDAAAVEMQTAGPANLLRPQPQAPLPARSSPAAAK